MNQITDLPQKGKSAGLRQLLYAIYCTALFTVMAVSALLLCLFLPTLRARRRVAGAFSRGFFRAAGIPLRVQGIEHLPRVPCVVVANHASYIDGIVAVAALPPEFAFVPSCHALSCITLEEYEIVLGFPSELGISYTYVRGVVTQTPGARHTPVSDRPIH